MGFNSKHHSELSKSSNQPISLTNCEIKKFLFSENYEVVVNQQTSVCMSPRKLDLSTLSQVSATCSDSQALVTTLDCIPSLDDYQLVDLSAKVLKVSHAIEVKAGLKKQDLIISDNSATSIH